MGSHRRSGVPSKLQRLRVLLLGGPLLLSMVFTASVRAGEDFQVNTTTAGSQLVGGVASLPDGSFLVSWTDASAGSSNRSIVVRRYDSVGNPLTGQIVANGAGTAYRRAEKVSAQTDRFLVTWFQRDAGGGIERDVFARPIDGDGDPLGAAVQLNTYTTDTQYATAIATDGNGGYTVTWQSAGSPGDDQDGSSIQARRLDSAGQPVGEQLQLNAYTTGSQSLPAIAHAGGGSFVAVWSSYASPDDDDSLSSVIGGRFDSNGEALGEQFQLNSFIQGSQNTPAISPIAEDEFIVAWRSVTLGAGNGFQASARRLTSNGQPFGAEFEINSTVTGDGSSRGTPAFARDPDDGSLMAVWRASLANSDGSGTAIIGRPLAADGTPLAVDFQFNTHTTGDVFGPTVAALGDGGWVATWTANSSSPGDDDAPPAVVGRIFIDDGIFTSGFEDGSACDWSSTTDPGTC